MFQVILQTLNLFHDIVFSFQLAILNIIKSILLQFLKYIFSSFDSTFFFVNLIQLKSEIIFCFCNLHSNFFIYHFNLFLCALYVLFFLLKFQLLISRFDVRLLIHFFSWVKLRIDLNICWNACWKIAFILLLLLFDETKLSFHYWVNSIIRWIWLWNLTCWDFGFLFWWWWQIINLFIICCVHICVFRREYFSIVVNVVRWRNLFDPKIFRRFEVISENGNDFLNFLIRILINIKVKMLINLTMILSILFFLNLFFS